MCAGLNGRFLTNVARKWDPWTMRTHRDDKEEKRENGSDFMGSRWPAMRDYRSIECYVFFNRNQIKRKHDRDSLMISLSGLCVVLYLCTMITTDLGKYSRQVMNIIINIKIRDKNSLSNFQVNGP